MDYNQIAKTAIVPFVKQYTRKSNVITEKLISLLVLFEKADANDEIQVHYNDYIYPLKSFFDKSGGLNNWLIPANKQYIVGKQSRTFRAGPNLLMLMDAILAVVQMQPLPQVTSIASDDILIKKIIFYRLAKLVGRKKKFSMFRLPLLLKQVKGTYGNFISSRINTSRRRCT
jgi:hypothetical protein